ncbi:MAG: hypothetical protein Q9180_003475 [Flavoplaca navasiana]
MASHAEGSNAEINIGGHSTPARRGRDGTFIVTLTTAVLSTTWRGQNVEVTLPYPGTSPGYPVFLLEAACVASVNAYLHSSTQSTRSLAATDSTAPPKDPNTSRAFQHLTKRDRHKRWRDINNPYVRIQKPTPPPDSRKATMAGGPSLLGVSKQRARTSKRATIPNNESSRQSSLLDTDIGMEGWPVVDGHGSVTVVDDNPKTPEAKVEEKEAPKKSLLQQLYELQANPDYRNQHLGHLHTIHSTFLQLPSPPSPPTALETLRSQELAFETHPPLGTEISAWAAENTAAVLPSSEDNSEAGNREGGYIKRFTARRRQVGNAEPAQENAVVKWDPFGGLWGYAANKKVWVVPKKEEVEEEKKKKKKKKKER